MASVSLFCGLLLVVGVKAFDPSNWSTDQKLSSDLYRAQLDDLVSVFLNFIDLESIAEGRITELTRKLENIRFHPLTLTELSEATERICLSFRERIQKLSTESKFQTENYEHLIIKLREAMAFFTRFDHLPASVRNLKYALGHTVNPNDLKFTEYPYSDYDDTEETIEYLSGVTERDMLDSEELEVSSEPESEEVESSTRDLTFQNRIGSIQDFEEETLDEISIPGVPGEDFPNYLEIPSTAFSCEDKDYVPGFYADLDASCQVFHVCLPHHREIFLCPTGSTFNQEILSCDYWYNSNCSLSPSFYDKNTKYLPEAVSEVPQSIPEDSTKDSDERYIDTLLMSSNGIKFFPVKFKTYNYPEGKRELDGTYNLFNWKLEKLLKSKKSADDFVDAVLQDKDWIRDSTSVLNSGKETMWKLSEETTLVSSISEEPLQRRLKLKGRKDSFEKTSKSKNDRSGDEFSIQITKQDSTAPATPVLEVSTDSALTTETDLNFSTPTISEESLESKQIAELDLDVTNQSSEQTKFPTLDSNQESSSTTTTVSKVSNTRKLKPLFPKLKGQKVLFGKENIAPAIVHNVLKATKSIVNKGILPLTGQILAESYSKHHKTKHCN